MKKLTNEDAATDARLESEMVRLSDEIAKLQTQRKELLKCRVDLHREFENGDILEWGAGKRTYRGRVIGAKAYLGDLAYGLSYRVERIRSDGSIGATMTVDDWRIRPKLFPRKDEE